MTKRLSGHFSLLGLVSLCSSRLGTARQYSREKFAILCLKPRSHVRILIGWFSNTTGTSLDDGKTRGKNLTRLPETNLPLCHWSSQLFDLRAPSSTDVPLLLLNQPNIWATPHFRNFKGRVQAFGATVSGIVWMEKLYLWLANGCLYTNHPIIITTPWSPKLSKKSLRPKAVAILPRVLEWAIVLWKFRDEGFHSMLKGSSEMGFGSVGGL